MTVKLLLNFGDKHPILPGRGHELTEGSTHTFDDEIEEQLVGMGHAELTRKQAAKQTAARGKKKKETVKTEPNPDTMLKTDANSDDYFKTESSPPED